MRTSRAIALGALLSVGCSAAAVKSGAEDEAPIDGAFDSFRSPVDHGALTLGTPVSATLTRDESFHAWTFDLTDTASVTLRTADAGDGEIDTVLYLYREGERGWGRYLARNDDVASSLLSALSRELEAGHYRVLVKGYDREVAGAFELASACEGAGCPSAGACLFGATYRQMRDSATFTVDAVSEIDASTALTADAEAQLVAAVRVAYEDASDRESALASVDQNEVNRVVLRERATGRVFVAYEYGAGDNSYGAVFEGDAPAIVAEIHDGDLYECTIGGAALGARIGADCGEGVDCAEGLVCTGIVDGWRGRCAPEGPIDGEGAACASAGECGEDLACADGTCTARWRIGSIGESWSLEIPDGDDAGLVRSETIYGVAPSVAGVILRASIAHPRLADLAITVTSPSGTTVELAAAAAIDRALEGFAGEAANGAWTLTIADRLAGEGGTLESWTLEVTTQR